MSIQENELEAESQTLSSPKLLDLERTTSATNGTLQTTIETMQLANACFDPRHYHSFQSVSFILLPIYKCAGCGERLQTAVPGSSSRPVQCIACKAYAHRSCAFSKQLKWKEKCSTNYKAYASSSVVHDALHPHASEPILSLNEGKDRSHSGAEENNSSDVPIPSIFRQSPLTEVIPLVYEERTVLPRAVSEDGILEKGRRGKTSFQCLSSSSPCIRATDTRIRTLNQINSTSHVLKESRTWDGPNSILKYDGSTPHLSLEEAILQPDASSAPLIPSLTTTATMAATTTTMTAGTTARAAPISTDVAALATGEAETSLELESATLEWTKHGPPPHWADTQEAFKVIGARSECSSREEDKTGSDEDHKNVDSSESPLYYARHGFQIVSQALQENITATFQPFVDRVIQRDGIIEIYSRSNETDASHSLPQETSSEKADTDCSDGVMNTLRAENNFYCVPSSQKRQLDECLLEESEPKSDQVVSRKGLGFAAVAGSLVGGVAGLAIAGPVGGIIGIKCGQTAGILGLLLEGSLTVGVLASGVAAGGYTCQHLQGKLEETRVLALGDGTQRRVLLLVRPSVKDPDPAWTELWQEARRTYPGKTGGLVHRFIPNEANAAKRDRYERELDIVQTREEEIGTADKVLLLVSRTLNNKESLPGHVYRHLVEAFRRRARDDAKKASSDRSKCNLQDYDADVATGGTDKIVVEEESRHIRRRSLDAHAVIKYVTATLLEVRPGFASSPFLTELTATAVEGLVFGEVYDSVMEEIEAEYENQDNELMEKIANFERSQSNDGADDAGSELILRSYKDFVSEEALEALHSLPQAHSAVDKLRYCVLFLERISDFFSKTQKDGAMGADSLLKMVCQHILAAKVFAINAQVAFLEEFARDDQLLKGREGYALVTLQASLHFLNSSSDFESDIFDQGDLDQ